MKTKILLVSFALLLLLPVQAIDAQRKFVHPGITYTQGDLDRMKAMIAARQEPFYSTYVKLSQYVTTPGTLTDITAIAEGQHNNTIGTDGRRAHDNALMWHLTGNTTYANSAVKYLNRYLNLTNSSYRGTGPLDNGKIYMLIDAAELMRDYPGWSAADQQKFKKMLVHPGYSTKTAPSSHISSTDANNDITFYWNIYNFDAGRFGNQGLFAARGLMAIGIFLDNDTIYDRAYRYLLAMPHRPDDLPYPSGPATVGSMNSETAYIKDYNATRNGPIADYGYDELLKYYIYQNGECQESCRDQGHVFAGLGNYTCIAEIAWSQGDSLYSCLNNRILTGIEYSTRYNLSYFKTYPDQPAPWEVSGFSTNEADCTYDNGVFYQAWSRSGRWFGKNIYPTDRGNVWNSGGWREQATAHYKVRAGIEPEKMKWLQRSHDLLIASYGYENWGVSGHQYEWNGWGTLTKRLKAWMAGDPVTWVNGERVSGMPSAPCTIKAVDYDFYSENGEGHTYHNAGKTKSTLYRTDGTIEIAQDGGDYVVTNMLAGEWMNYSVIFPAPAGNTTAGITKKFNIYATYKSAGAGVKLFAAIDDDETKKGKELEPASTWTERCLGTFTVPCGASVVRLYVKGASNLLQLKNIRIEALQSERLGVVDLPSTASSIRVYDASNVDMTEDNLPVIAAATDGSKDTPINLPHQKFLVFDFGEDGLDIQKITLYNDGVTMDTREMAKVLGATADGKYTGAWDRNTAGDILRTNGATYTLNVPVLNNSWVTTNGSKGSYSIGPVGKYRYFAFYNWSTAGLISELEISSVISGSAVEEDTEPAAEWDNTDDTNTALVIGKAAGVALKLLVDGWNVIVPGASAIEACSVTGSKYAASKTEQIGLAPGVYILKIKANGQTINRKVIIK